VKETPPFKTNQVVYFYHKYTKEILTGKIVEIRPLNLNWDYQIRYNIYYMDVNIWTEQKYIARSSKELQDKYL
jgi:hypothetical protein